MNTNVFYSHNLNERMALVNKFGEFISRIKYYGFYINLYVLETQFVEVYYNMHSNTIEKVEILSPLDSRLNIYAGGVDIRDIFKKP